MRRSGAWCEQEQCLHVQSPRHCLLSPVQSLPERRPSTLITQTTHNSTPSLAWSSTKLCSPQPHRHHCLPDSQDHFLALGQNHSSKTGSATTRGHPFHASTNTWHVEQYRDWPCVIVSSQQSRRFLMIIISSLKLFLRVVTSVCCRQSKTPTNASQNALKRYPLCVCVCVSFLWWVRQDLAFAKRQNCSLSGSKDLEAT